MVVVPPPELESSPLLPPLLPVTNTSPKSVLVLLKSIPGHFLDLLLGVVRESGSQDAGHGGRQLPLRQQRLSLEGILTSYFILLFTKKTGAYENNLRVSLASKYTYYE
jgi:hypothetical protein